MRDAPVGRLTLVFTDIEGSSALWERHPDAMRAGLDRHNALLRAEIARHGGYEVKTEGDAFMVAFASPEAATAWCGDAQVALAGEEWPAGLPSDAAIPGLRVRMGAHLGAPDCRVDPLTGRMDYFGPMVNRAARVGAAAHGGQILLSGSAFAAVSPAVDRLGLVVADLGRHGLKGLDEPENLFQVTPAVFAGRRFPPPRTVPLRRTNLGEETAPFVGRDEALDGLVARLDAGARCLTVVGPGGIGKTRLVRHLGRRLVAGLPVGHGGVWFVDATTATDGYRLAEAVADALDLPPSADPPSGAPGDRLVAGLSARAPLILLLDNLEQVVGAAAALLAGWLAAVPGLAAVNTSREPLAIAPEETFELGPLDPAAGADLFLEHARARVPLLARIPAVDALVRRLDGIPLALELAAARCGSLTVEALLARLGESPDLLRNRRRDVPDRQATLRATIDWSWRMLDAAERAVLAQCAVFRGGFTAGAAEAAVRPGPGAPPALDLLESLRDKSLLRFRPGPSADVPGRFGMYETIRDFVRPTLDPADRELARRHAAYYADFVERRGSRALFRLLRHEDERAALLAETDNLHAALDWAFKADPPLAIRLAIALYPIVEARGTPDRRRVVYDGAVDAARGAGERAPLAELLALRARLRWFAGDIPAAESDCGEALALAAEAKNDRLAGRCLATRGNLVIHTDRFEEGARDFAAARAIAERLGDRSLEAEVHVDLGNMLIRQCRFAEARITLERGVRLLREAGLFGEEALPLCKLGFIAWQEGREGDAHVHYQAALRIVEALDNPILESFIRWWYGETLVAIGDAAGARGQLAAALRIARETGMVHNEAGIQFNLAVLEQEAGRYDAALAHAEAALRIARGVGDALTTGCLRFFLVGIRAGLGEIEAAEADLAAGRAAVPAEFQASEGLTLIDMYVTLARARLDPALDGARRSALLAEVRDRIAAAASPGAPVADAELPAAIARVPGNRRSLIRSLHATWRAAAGA